MLDSDTKRRIDSCRDILVGKVPDPKSQVEQITIALIYKFMDDMDAEAEELGGKRSFFAGEYAKYGWARLMAPNMGGFDVLALYSEAIGKMNENPGIPALFRDIFKNAYLPYRDPETLRAFLKEIDGFTYDHSERLGDAFEYLLSVLGSQGDAGQFRTPRHIIDFMVEIIDPKKNESVLDPACGTAGFLISAWKHILRQNTKTRTGDLLTPEERATLVANIHGYDISPDMVRLSLVNLYLHGFTDPHIVEYDTLTSEERWNETADIILANPPFMSPKGGIKPHKRFSVQATRSEVLFVDYIAEHLSPQGRAAIVVPEGIIFQSGTAYKKLREMLVKTSLVAVVSLPAGVFNPYSGVKTSILILDKRLAKNCDSVLFVKVENDGFNLGAQRRAITGSDLPDAVKQLRKFFADAAGFDSAQMAHKVARVQIGASGEWNLSADRYRNSPDIQAAYEIVQIGDVVSTITPPLKLQKESYSAAGRYPIIDQSQQEIAGWTNDEFAVIRPAKPLVIFGDHTCAVKLIKQPFAQGADGIKILETNNQLLPEFLYYSLKANPLATDGYKRHFTDLKRKLLPLPPLAIQQEIVAEIEGYQKIIDGARQVVENYRPRINVQPDWPVVALGEIIEGKPKNGYSGKPVDYETSTKVLSLSATTSGVLDISRTKYLDEDIPNDAACRCRQGDIYLQRGNTAELVGTAAIFDVNEVNYIYPDLMIRVRADETKILSHYLLHQLQSPSVRNYITRNAVGAAGSMPKINQGIVERIPIPLPDLETQRAIVAEIQAEQALVNANKELIGCFEAKIKATINRVWGSSE
ncbi:type I restriction enzyme M protein [Azospira oryzae]|uniref:site-specific DNA-methyltransferase (adenine-specific) n=1 Tax=Azospira oryzae TaxID=146939 RepID=A0ABY0IR71_9RHOO|nr:N-6 DNA methylase [Azospira oryzae]RZT89516.1 type I restriction enzyme M protein [Azospira oryzae]